MIYAFFAICGYVQLFRSSEFIAFKMAMFVRFILLLISRLKCAIASRHSVSLIFFAACNKGEAVGHMRLISIQSTSY